ncbi:MAG: DUF4184 family protein [Planctomycetaceae bacterium]|nr:DUF4184 family protein [Planctomycetaceae bacterium]
MPFTPFHFGPVLFAKGLCPNRAWVIPFIIANVLVDCEVLYRLRFSLKPIHHLCHTYIGGAVIGSLAAFIWYFVITRTSRNGLVRRFLIRPDSSTRSLLIDSVVSGVIGGVSHVFLDSLMHADMHPFWPFALGNSLAGLIGVGLLHILLAASGFFGLILWLLMREP